MKVSLREVNCRPARQAWRLPCYHRGNGAPALNLPPLAQSLIQQPDREPHDLYFRPLFRKVSDNRMKKALLLVLIGSLSAPVFAESAHIADDVYVFMNSGPSNQYRINGRVSSGEAVEILDRRDDYIQIRTESGKVGWVPAPFVAKGVSDLSRMPELEAALSASQKRVEAQQKEIEILQQSAQARLQESEQARNRVVELEQEISTLKTQIANMDQSNLIRWLTHGGLVALGGVLLGLLVPYLPKKRKQRSDWF
jgi:SH3 domain protein